MGNKTVIRSCERAEFGETAQTQLEAAGIWCAFEDSNDPTTRMVLPSDAGNIVCK
jgi:hypothetical protein